MSSCGKIVEKLKKIKKRKRKKMTHDGSTKS